MPNVFDTRLLKKPLNLNDLPSYNKNEVPVDPIEQDLLPGQRALGAETQGLITDKLARAGRPESERVAEMLHGVDEAGAPFQQTAGKVHEDTSPLAMASPQGLGEALERRAGKDYASKQRELERTAEFQGLTKRSDELSGVSSLLARSEGVKQQLFQQKMQHYQQLQQLKAQKDKERGDFLSSIIGLGGAIIGAAIGGPAGAVIGGGVAKSGSQALSSGPSELA